MKLQRLHLNDFQSYDDEEVTFDEGISIIYGENGSGKSTLLRGIFAALFQTSMKSELSGDINIGGLVNKNKSSGSVELDFTENETEYTVFWEIGVTEDDEGDRRGRTKTCTLTAEDGSVNLASVTEVADFMANLLGLDAQAFVNSVYVQQEELTKLLTADTDTRKEIFDRLLGLQDIDKYIERMDKARREVKSVRKEKTNRKEELQGQLDEKPNRSDLETKEQRLKKDISTLESEISELREKKDSLTAKRTQLESTGETADELHERKDSLESERDEIQSDIGKINATISQLKKEREQLEQEIEDVPDDDIAVLKEQLDSLRSERDELKEQLMELQSEVNSVQSDIKSKLQEVSNINSEIQQLQSKKTEKSKRLGEVRGELNSKINDRDRLRDALINTTSTSLQTVPSVETAIKNIKEERDEAESDAERKRSTIEDIRSTIAKKEERRNNITNRLEVLSNELDLPDAFEDTSVTERPIEDIENEIVSKTDVSELTEDTAYQLLVSQLPEEQRSVRDEGDEYDTIESRRLATLYYTQLTEQKETQKEIDSLEAESETLEEEIAEAQERKTRLNLQLNDLQDTIVERNSQYEKAKQLKTVLQDITELQEVEASAVDEEKNIADEVSDLESEREAVEKEMLSIEEEYTEVKTEFDTLTTKVSDIEEQISAVEPQLETLREAQQTRNEIEQIETKISNKRDRVKDKVGQKNSAEDELESVKEKLSDIDESDMSLEEVEAEIEDVEKSIQKKEGSKDSKNAELVSVQSTIEDIETLQGRVKSFEDSIQSLTTKLEQVKAVKQSYVSVKESTRRQYLSKINQYTNEIFTAIYENKAYESVHIDGDYRITLRTTDGTEIEPALTSGGESAIVNLALRAGVYRVITEAGNNSLPPFILDEPTTFLDSQHVGKLEALARKMADWDIKQVFIVSHNEQLIESGDAVYHVTKGTNASSVEREF